MKDSCIVIPVYNHGATVAEVICKAKKFQLPIIVIDDGSTDMTFENIKNINGIQIIRHHRNIGKGAALISGFVKASPFAKWAICLDADGQHDPENIQDLIHARPSNQRAIIIGKRKGMVSAPRTSQFGRKFSNFWVWISGGPLLEDSQSGFRCYPLPEVLHLNVHARRYQYEVEVIAKAAWEGIPIIEVPVQVSYLPQGQRISHFHPWRDFLRNAQTFSRLIVKRLFNPNLWFLHHP